MRRIFSLIFLLFAIVLLVGLVGKSGVSAPIFDRIAHSSRMLVYDLNALVGREYEPPKVEAPRYYDKLKEYTDFNLENFAAYGQVISRVAYGNDLDPDLLRAVIIVESKFEPGLISPSGRVGLMQLAPYVADEIGVGDVFDPAENIMGGARWLRGLIDTFGGDLERALAAYQGGAGEVTKHGGVPPVPETQQYVEKVLIIYRIMQGREE